MSTDASAGCVLYHYGITEFKYYTVIFGVSRGMVPSRLSLCASRLRSFGNSTGRTYAVGVGKRYAYPFRYTSARAAQLRSSALGLPIERPKCEILDLVTLLGHMLTFKIALSMDEIEKLVKAS